MKSNKVKSERENSRETPLILLGRSTKQKGIFLWTCIVQWMFWPTWYVAEHSILQLGQGETECYMFRPLVSHSKLNQQSSGGSLEVKAALQHSRLRSGSFGWQIHNHQTLKLLKELLRHRVATPLGLLPRHLEPVERLVHLHHLLMESAHGHCAWTLTEQDKEG